MKAVNADEVLKVLNKYGAYIFVTDAKKYTDMVDEILNLEELKLWSEVTCPHSCGYCKHNRVPRYIEPCRSCSIKDVNMTNFIDNFEPREGE